MRLVFNMPTVRKNTPKERKMVLKNWSWLRNSRSARHRDGMDNIRMKEVIHTNRWLRM